MNGELPGLRANDYRDTWCGQVVGDRVDTPARLAGWVHRRRDHGGRQVGAVDTDDDAGWAAAPVLGRGDVPVRTSAGGRGRRRRRGGR